MSAVVCGKRSSIIEESPSSPPVSKRIRCSSSSSPGRTFSPPRAAAASNYCASNPAIDHLVSRFPAVNSSTTTTVMTAHMAFCLIPLNDGSIKYNNETNVKENPTFSE